MRNTEENSSDSAISQAIKLDDPRYGVWLRLTGVYLFLCATGVSLIFIDLVRRLHLATGIDIIDRALPFVVGLSIAWIIVVCSVAVGVDQIQVGSAGQKFKRAKSAGSPEGLLLRIAKISNGQKVQIAVLGLSLIVAGVRVAKTMETQESSLRDAWIAAKKAYEGRLDTWRISEDGQEYAKAKAQIRRLRALGTQLLEDGRRLSHPKKRRDGAALLKAAETIDISKLERTMPRAPKPEAAAAPLAPWKFANIVVWPALLELVCIELLVLAIAFWARNAFAPLKVSTGALDHYEFEEDEDDDDEVPGPGLRVVPPPVHPVFASFDFNALNAAVEDEPECAEAEAWSEAKQGLDLLAATWRGLRITSGTQWTKRVGARRRRFVWPVVVEASGRAVFIGTQAALRLVSSSYETDR